MKLSERFLESQNANYQLPEDVRWEIALHERLLKGIIIFRFFAFCLYRSINNLILEVRLKSFALFGLVRLSWKLY